MKTVLIVDDVRETRRWLSALVGAAFPAARITEAAIRRAGLGALHEPFDLALLDIGLPDGSGTRCAPRPLCVVTTVTGDDARVVAALSCGADGYLLQGQRAEVLTRPLAQLTMGIPAPHHEAFPPDRPERPTGAVSPRERPRCSG